MVWMIQSGTSIKFFLPCGRYLINFLLEESILNCRLVETIRSSFALKDELKIRVAQRAIVAWPDIVKVIKFWMSLPKQKQPSEEHKSYERLKIAMKDPLIIVKFKLCENIARHLNSFLVQFQTDEHMVPFLSQRLDDTMCWLAWRIVLKYVMTKANTCVSFIKVNIKSISVHKRPEDVDAGVATKFEMQELVKKKELMILNV